MQVTPLSSEIKSLESICSGSLSFSEFSETGGATLPEDSKNVTGTLPLVEDDDFSEQFFTRQNDSFSEHRHFVAVDDSDHFSSEYDLPEEDYSSDSSEQDAEANISWVRTKSGRSGKILETAEDEYEKIALIETDDGKSEYRHQTSYRLSSELTQKLKMSSTGNYYPVEVEEKAEPQPGSTKEGVACPWQMDQFGNFVLVSAMKKEEKEGKEPETAQKQCRFAELEDTDPAEKVVRQVTRHIKGLYIYS
jgi:hypothetical protein